MTIDGLVNALRDPAGPPRTVGALVSALGVAIDAAALAAGGHGTLDLVVATPGAGVTRLVAKYGWWFGGGAVTTIEDLRERLLIEWNATIAHAGEQEIEKVLRERHGAPREVGRSHVYDTYVVTRHAGGGIDLAYYVKLPDWAVPPPDAAVRTRVLRELAAAVASAEASWDTHAVARVLEALPAGCGLEHPVAEGNEHHSSVHFVPGIASTELVQIFGWQNAVAQCRSMHLDDWEVWLVTGRNEYGAATVSRPAFGQWSVTAALDGWPTGGQLVAGGPFQPLGGTHALAPADLVRVLGIGLGIAPGARPPPPPPAAEPHTCASCGQTTLLAAAAPPEENASIHRETSGLDGRPSFGGDLASDAVILARELALVTCPWCNHIAPSIATPWRHMAEAREAREQLFAMTNHCEAARRYLYIAQIHGEDDVREEAIWLLRAAWANEAAGLFDVARRIRRRAGNALAEVVRGGQGLEEQLGPSSLVLAEIFRTAGEPALAAGHCHRGYVAAGQDEEGALLLLAEASYIIGGLTEPLTRVRAMERARSIDSAERAKLLEELARAARSDGSPGR